MGVFLEIVQFELRQQLKSPFLLAALLLFFVVHLLTVTSTGITLWQHPLANVNSAYAISVVEATLGAFGMLLVIVFVANAALRDHDTANAELLFVKPISKGQYLWGRFTASSLLTVLLGLVGLVGSLTGTMMPWVDQERVAPLSAEPWLFCFFAIVLPNMLILSALFFGAAMLTRSLAGTFALALILLVGDVVVANLVIDGTVTSSFGALADRSAAMVVNAASRNLTVAELNTLYPTALLLENRLLWLAISFAVMTFAFSRFRLEISEPGLPRWLRSRKLPARARHPAPRPQRVVAADAVRTGPVAGGALAQLRSQVRMDLACVLRSPLFVLILVLGIFSDVSDYGTHATLGSPVHPVTSSMLDFFRYGVIGLILPICIYYSGMLVHRERESSIDGIVGAMPIPDWILPLSKTLALCAVVTLLLAVLMLTSMALQALNGYTNFELGLYLRTVFVHNGFYFWMLCVLAVTVQVVTPNKWLGMLLVLAINVALLTLPNFGFEHLLYRYTIPHITYSDMNGFGHLSQQVFALIGYWGCFCVLLVVLAHLLYPRGIYTSSRERARIAAARFSKPVAATTAIFAVSFMTVGTWIFYNTNVLNTYRTEEDRQRAQADYERRYGQYEKQPAPSFSNIDLTIDLFPEERRLESRGSATLTNTKAVPITDLVISVEPHMRVHEVRVDSATRAIADAAQGFYLFKLTSPMEPGESASIRWNMSRINHGFANSDNDTEVVENGTFITSLAVIPMPGFDDGRKLTDNAARKRMGLKPAPRLAPLGDPESLGKLSYGVDTRTNYRVIFGTAADQIALAPGRLEREWREGGRRYFEYVPERPTWPAFYFLSARYAVARDKWHDDNQEVAVEVYYDPKHAYNVDAMLATAKRSLDYFTREFAPYQYSVYRIMEYPRYRMAAKAAPGGVAHSEAAGWIANLNWLHNVDYGTIHELSHQWWGDQAYGARMQGRKLLNEGLAQYSVLMVFRKYDQDENAGPDTVNRLAADMQRCYLRGRGEDSRFEQPVTRSDDQDYLNYCKGAAVMYTLQDLIGEEAVNRALRNYLAKFGLKGPPFPTSMDLVNELRAVAGPDHQELITDLFEKIVLYEVEMTDASVAEVDGGYEVTLTVSAGKREATAHGTETAAPLRAWFDVGLFADAKQPVEQQIPLYLGKHLLKSGINTIKVRSAKKPALARVDPFEKMADRWPNDNGRALEVSSTSSTVRKQRT